MVLEYNSTMDMKIAEVCAVYPPYKGGLGVVCADNAASFARAGHMVTVIVPWYARERGATLEHEERDGIRIWRVRPTLEYGNAAWVRGLARVLEGFDVVHFHYPFIGALDEVLAWKKKTGGKLLVTYHMDLVADKGIRKYFFPRYVQGALPRLVAESDGIIATSLDYIQNSQVTSFLSSDTRLFTVPNAVDTSWYTPSNDGVRKLRDRYGIAMGENIILFVGGMDAAHSFKGVPILIDAFSMLSEEVRTTSRLVLVGKGSLRDDYSAHASRVGIGDRVILPGGVSDEEKRTWYRACTMSVLPSTERSEAFGIVLVEAMACGKPVITTNLPGPRSVVDEEANGLLVPPNDGGALSGALMRLLSDQPLAYAMGECGLKKVHERYSSEVAGKNLCDVVISL